MKEKIMEAAKKQFKPEFLNRLDDVVVFHMLEKAALNVIVDLESTKLIERLKEKGITLKLDKTARELLMEKGYDPNYGARPMRRAVERYLEDPLAESLLRADITEGDTVKVTRKKDAKELTFTPVKPTGKGKGKGKGKGTAKA